MKLSNIIIAVDGYSSTGKSSFARLAAKDLGLVYLDSGALYRAVTLFAQENALISEDNVVSDALKDALCGLDVHFNQQGQTCIADRVIETEIRQMKVSSQVSPIAAVPYVREFVDATLHLLGSRGGVIMDGRDIGTTVFPSAQVKVFMTASEQVRAQRRFAEMQAAGTNATLQDVIENLRQRDYIDSHRETSPLRQAQDAFVLDNSNMTMSEELAWLRGLVQGRLGQYE